MNLNFRFIIPTATFIWAMFSHDIILLVGSGFALILIELVNIEDKLINKSK